MAINYVIDTDVLIDVQRGHSGAIAWFGGLTDLPAVPGIVAMELIQDALNARQVRDVQTLIAPLPIVWPTESDCQRALNDFTVLHLSHGLGLLDSLIASCAVGLELPLLTFNIKHYRHIPGLTTHQSYVK